MRKSLSDTISFDSMRLAPAICKAVSRKGYTTPTAVQARAIPPITRGRDVMAAAQTGTGKTAAFTLPLLHLLSRGEKARPGRVRALILTPTRELAAQIDQCARDYGRGLNLHTHVVFGGVNIKPQIQKLHRGTDILIATPGRLLDLYGQGAMDFHELETLVLDEADRMLDMGFIHDIKKIIKLLPGDRQNLLFSATLSRDIRDLAKTFVKNPLEISVTPKTVTVEAIKQVVHPVSKNQKSKLLIKLIKDNNWTQALVFSRTKHGANRLARGLERQGVHADAIHGNKSQGARSRALESFKKGRTRILVATDIASRGLDISQMPQVVNYDLPNVPEDYVHRIGRTGRAGAGGNAVSLVSPDESKQLSDIQKLTRQKIPQVVIEGFAPNGDLPAAASPQRRSRPQSQSPRKSFRAPSKRNKGRSQGSSKSVKRPAREQGNGGGRRINKRMDIAEPRGMVQTRRIGGLVVDCTRKIRDFLGLKSKDERTNKAFWAEEIRKNIARHSIRRNKESLAKTC